MAAYIVGDLHGCLDRLKQLLKIVDFSFEDDELLLTGDLIGRGPQSLETLRFLKSLGNSVNFVLGNHDLNLLAINQGIRKCNKSDKLFELLNAPDCDELLKWLRLHPLLIEHPKFKFVIVHAGIYPTWTIDQAKKYAKEIETKLHGIYFKTLLKEMYGDHCRIWDEKLTGLDRTRFIINALTRMRYCTKSYEIELNSKLSPDSTDTDDLIPWFEFNSLDLSSDIIFGHWAALMGKVDRAKLFALDTGCVWGNSLTMLRWDDQKYFSLPCHSYRLEE